MAFDMPAMRASELLVAAGTPKNVGPDEAAPAEFQVGGEPGDVPFLEPARDGADVLGGDHAVGEAGARPLQDGIGGGMAWRAVEAGEAAITPRAAGR
jgi:hypothetical protein